MSTTSRSNSGPDRNRFRRALDDAVGEHAVGEPVHGSRLLRAIDDVVEHLGGEHLVEHALEHRTLRDLAGGGVDERAGERLRDRALGPGAREDAVGRDVGDGRGEQGIERVEREPRAGPLADRDDGDHRPRGLAAGADAQSCAADDQVQWLGHAWSTSSGVGLRSSARAALSIAEATITRLMTKSQKRIVKATPSEP